MDAYRNDLASARKRIDELETALEAAQDEIARLKAPPARPPLQPAERTLGVAIGLGVMLVGAVGAQVASPPERARTVVATPNPELVPPPVVPPLDVEALTDEPPPARDLRPEDARQLADPIELPKLAGADADLTEEAIYDEGADGPSPEDPFLSSDGADAHTRYLLGKSAYQVGDHRLALDQLIEAVQQGGSPRRNPAWLRDAYLLLGQSAEHLGHAAVARQAYEQAYGLERP